jgi:hypothetical protein
MLKWLDGKEEKLASDKVEEVNQLLAKKELEDCCICHSSILLTVSIIFKWRAIRLKFNRMLYEDFELFFKS